jgi:hypothetical protein
MSANTPIDVDDPARDEAAIRERLMSELGKRQIDAEKNGRSMEFNVTDVWQASFPAYQSKEHVDNQLNLGQSIHLDIASWSS